MKRKVIRVFLSVPMKGKTDFEVNMELAELVADVYKYFDAVDVKEELYFVHNFEPEIKVINKENVSKTYFLGQAIQKLGDCDYIAMHRDWMYTNGCFIEHEVADRYGIQILSYEEGNDILTLEDCLDDDLR